MRRIERHQRRETIAPVGDIIQHPGIRRFVSVEHLDVRTDGPGVGERYADIEADARGSVIQCGNLQRVVLLRHDDAGALSTSLRVTPRAAMM